MNSEAELQLEQLLEKAATKPAQRPQFLDALLSSNIYCLGFSSHSESEGDDQNEVLPEGSHVQLLHFKKEDGSEYLPIFTSLKVLQQAIEYEQSYLKMPIKQFFELTLGTTIILNPDSEYGKEFLPKEIQGLLNGQYGCFIEQYEYQETTEVLLSQPKDYPQEMIQELNSFFKANGLVKAAYFIQMHDVQRDPQPTLLIGFSVCRSLSEVEFQKLKNSIGHIAYTSLANKKLVDLLFIDEVQTQDGIGQYLLESVKPFYKKSEQKKKGFFAKLFS